MNADHLARRREAELARLTTAVVRLCEMLFGERPLLLVDGRLDALTGGLQTIGALADLMEYLLEVNHERQDLEAGGATRRRRVERPSRRPYGKARP